VLARSPEQKGKLIVKRVIATGGTTLHVPPPEDSGLGVHIDSIVDIPEGHVWLSGDNMPFSQDSRSYGPVPSRNLLGRLVVAVRSRLLRIPTALLHSSDQLSSNRLCLGQANVIECM
jgi:type IV secretory pathway protease TraF